MALNIAAIRARADAATPGPWCARWIADPWPGEDPEDPESGGWWAVWEPGRPGGEGEVLTPSLDRPTDESRRLAEFVAAARTDVLDLIDEVERLRRLIDPPLGPDVFEEVHRLRAVLDDRARACPYVVTGDEGTSHCTLAERSH